MNLCRIGRNKNVHFYRYPYIGYISIAYLLHRPIMSSSCQPAYNASVFVVRMIGDALICSFRPNEKRKYHPASCTT